jgi:uncharacterized membrane protein YdbT with pleckstrin-like domain
MQIKYQGSQSSKLFALLMIRNVIFSIVIIGLVWMVKDIFAYFGRKIVLHEDGVQFTEGLIVTHSKEVPYSNINVVSVKQGVFGKIFNYGDLIVSTGGDAPDILFKNLHDPMRFKEFINKEI